jgi:hypothetical protein
VAKPETPPSPASRMIQAPGGLENPHDCRFDQNDQGRTATKDAGRIWIKMLALRRKNIWRLDITWHILIWSNYSNNVRGKQLIYFGQHDLISPQ